jgi:hypothetical protein
MLTRAAKVAAVIPSAAILSRSWPPGRVGIEVRDPVIAEVRPEHKDVVASTTGHGVVAGTASHPVVADAAIEDVIATIAKQLVVAVAAEQLIGTGAPVKVVAAIHCTQPPGHLGVGQQLAQALSGGMRLSNENLLQDELEIGFDEIGHFLPPLKPSS